MLFNVAFGFAALTGLSCAKQLTFSNTQDAYTCAALTTQFDLLSPAAGPEIRNALNKIIPMLDAIDKDIRSLTPANSPTVSKSVNDKAKALATALENSAKQLENSKPIGGITEVITLIGPANNALKTVNSTINGLLAQKMTIRNAKELPMWIDGFNNMKPGTLALVKAALAQIPPSLLAQSPVPIPTNEKIAPILDNLFDQLINLFTGKQDSFTIPAAAIALVPGLQCENAPKGAAPVLAPAKQVVHQRF